MDTIVTSVEQARNQVAVKWPDILSEAKSFESDFELYNKVVEMLPDRSHSYYVRGLAKSRSHIDPLDDYNSALEIDPENADVYLARGIELIEKGEYVDAINDLSRSIALQSHNNLAHYNRGVAYLRLGILGQALEDFRYAYFDKPPIELVTICDLGLE